MSIVIVNWSGIIGIKSISHISSNNHGNALVWHFLTTSRHWCYWCWTRCCLYQVVWNEKLLIKVWTERLNLYLEYLEWQSFHQLGVQLLVYVHLSRLFGVFCQAFRNFELPDNFHLHWNRCPPNIVQRDLCYCNQCRTESNFGALISYFNDEKPLRTLAYYSNCRRTNGVDTWRKHHHLHWMRKPECGLMIMLTVVIRIMQILQITLNSRFFWFLFIHWSSISSEADLPRSFKHPSLNFP